MAAGDALPGLGHRVRTLRKEHRLSRSNLALAVGCSTSAVAGIENGSRLPSLPLAVYLAQYLETTVDYLATGRER